MSHRVLLAAWLSLAAAAAQSTDVVLSGTVSDPTGASVPAATVTAENTKTGVRNTTRTNDAGVYIFPALLPGIYRLTVEMPGFRKAVYDDIEAEVAARLTLDVRLEVGSAAETVEVEATAGVQIGYATSSVGSVITGRQVLELPLAGRNAMELLRTQAGVTGPNGGENFNGARVGSLNVSVDGTNIQDNLLNSLFLTQVVSGLSVDRIEEFRVVTSPSDAELGRGSGQIQALTRSGTNEFHGSLFHELRNRSLTANSYFNNLRGDRRDFLIRNFFGGRVGGPIRKNKTFFHFFYENRMERFSQTITRTVLTDTARRGLWRFYPGARNANAIASIPTVDLAGNPVRPPTATGDLEAVSVFGRDPNRPAADTTGLIAKQLELMPLPNNFQAGDGLNTAGYTWNRPRPYDFRQFDIRLDHQFTSEHRLSYTLSWQSSESSNYIAGQNFPASQTANTPNETNLMALAFTSTLRSNLLNEFRAGLLRPRQTFASPWVVAGTGILPAAAGQPYLMCLGSGANSPMCPGVGDDPSSRISPVYQYSDSLTWLKGKHSFKGGAEVRFVSAAGYDSFYVMPRVTLGSAALPVVNINTIPGIGVNLGAQSLLTDLAGSVSFVTQLFNSPGGSNPAFVPGLTRYQHVKQPEFSWYFKDDFKVTPSLTLNLGLRYEWYAVPVEHTGKGLALQGGSGSIFGISGTSFADMYQPGRQGGSLTRLTPIGPNTANPDGRYFRQDWNNFAPAVGLSWAIPYFGKNKTILRLGYGIGYERNPIFLSSINSGSQPGYASFTTFFRTSRLDLSQLSLPLAPSNQPLATIPLNSQRDQTVYTYDDNLRVPYYQNFNVSVQRTISKDTILDVRYVGNKGVRLIQNTNINEVNIHENGILDAYRITQAGGHAPLLDRIFMGINIPGLGVVDGVRITGSDAMRSNNGGMQGFLFNNDVSGFASFLNTTSQVTNQVGGLLRRVGLPENFVVPNPQFSTARLTSNYGSSSYHSLQVELVKRFSTGWTFQGNYTWSKVLGDYEGDGSSLDHNFRTLRNRSLDKQILSYHRAHVWRSNGIWELPFGPGKRLGRDSRGLLSHLIGGWQTGLLFTMSTGAPISPGAAGGTYNNFGDATPVSVADFSRGFGEAKRVGDGVVYFTGLRQVRDPHVPQITAVNGIQGRSTMLAVTDESGKVLLVNPQPGQLGSLARRFLTGPGSFRLDVNVLKRIRIREGKEFHLRADAVDATNSPRFGNPETNINSLNFGRITSADGNRIIVISARLNF